MLTLQVYMGLAWILGCVVFGLLIVKSGGDCRIARQYLCQTAMFMCGLSLLALTTVQGNYHAYVMFVWFYGESIVSNFPFNLKFFFEGIFCGGYHYSLKMYTFEKVRARNFARAWGFVQFSQSIPIAVGVPVTGYLNIYSGGLNGYYFSSACVFIGSVLLFFVNLHKRNIQRHKHTR